MVIYRITKKNFTKDTKIRKTNFMIKLQKSMLQRHLKLQFQVHLINKAWRNYCKIFFKKNQTFSKLISILINAKQRMYTKFLENVMHQISYHKNIKLLKVQQSLQIHYTAYGNKTSIILQVNNNKCLTRYLYQRKSIMTSTFLEIKISLNPLTT